ncbi:hypothetical protein [Devosia sp. 2618]|uniref:hypothetical protein n=1 Tax=Devosia sp. 2618 TaxID=3156454 RepID=UPI003394CFFA
MAGVQKLSIYGAHMQQTAKRRQLAQHGLSQSQSLRSAMVGNINSAVQGQVDLTAQLLRSKSADSAKVKLNAINKTA